MQTTSDGWGDKTAQGKRRLGYGLLVAWLRTTNSGVKYFTINQSTIGGGDILKGGGGFVTFFDKYQYDDATPYVMSISVQKNIGQYPYGIIMGQADIELDNTTKKFLPNYDATIGSGILPNRPVKVSVGVENEFMKLFTGFTSQPEISLNDRTLQMHAFDAFNYINGYRSTISGAFVNAPLHNIIASGMQEMGFSSTQYAIDKSLQQNIAYMATYDQKWGDILKKGTEAEQALMFCDENGIIRFWNRQHFLTQSGVAQFQLSYSKIEDIKWQNTPIINDVIVKAKPRELQSIQKVWENELPVEIPGGNVDHELFINFTDEYGEMPVTSPSIPQTYTVASGVTSSYKAYKYSDASGPDMASYITVTDAYSFGTTYKLTFRNSYTSSVYLTQLAIYGQPARVNGVIKERIQDDTSIDVFGRNPSNNGEPIEIENDMIQNSDTARTLAYTLVDQYKSPGKRYVCPIAVQSDPALQIGDSGLLLINDTNETKTVYITGITNVIDRGGLYHQVLEVEERTIKSYFTINQSTIGGSDLIAP